MKFFRRSKDKKKDSFLDVPYSGGGRRPSNSSFQEPQFSPQWTGYLPPPTYHSARLLSYLPPSALERIFAFTSPQSLDESYETCEKSFVENACMLCDLRDLAHCAQVCKKWRDSARKLLYHSIRIDSVHYCEREAFLAERRKHRNFFDRNGEPEDTSHVRLKLLCRTLREDPTRLGKLVRFFKTPYMLRESSTPDLARTIAVLPNLRYVDLPEGLFSDDPAFSTLRLEVQARCRDLRKMTYMAGAEKSLEQLAMGNLWENLEVLELIKVNMDPRMMRHVLAGLSNLRALKVTETRSFSDELFAFNENLPHFPALAEIVLKKTPKVTEAGLKEFLSRPDAGSALRVLSLWKTGVKPTRLQDILDYATNLKTLSIHDTVDAAIPSGAGLRRLASRSLESVRFEVSNSSDDGPYSSAAASHYTYLASSILAGGLPRLKSVYVRDVNFPDQLMGIDLPPIPSFPGHNRTSSASSGWGPGGGKFSPPKSMNGFPLQPPRRGGADPANRFSSNNPFAGTGSLSRTLEVFTKSDEGMDWSFVQVNPIHSTGPGSRFGKAGGGQRPQSSYGLDTDVTGMGWNSGGARRSIMVGNGTGGFLALPGDSGGGAGGGKGGDEDAWPRPVSSAGERKGDRDLWR
ncbi:related to F-box domain protein [Cephalotrichum gorgonifer]|uniref:Related to F-box domain protein n=1 Tax=Cephalotrichum gorgonifer TaxID=2041049 RepID=A0AAE8MSF9_9PEZI|nr:related to F-box domain protein [Cephalotrichum gorgonifer]